MILGKDLVYIMNKTGPRTDPWGTPYFKELGLEKELQILTDWDLQVR